MKNMDTPKHGQGTRCTKMGADSLAKIPQMPQNLSAQFVCSSPKVLDFNEKRLYWASVVRILRTAINHFTQYGQSQSE